MLSFSFRAFSRSLFSPISRAPGTVLPSSPVATASACFQYRYIRSHFQSNQRELALLMMELRCCWPCCMVKTITRCSASNPWRPADHMDVHIVHPGQYKELIASEYSDSDRR